jgi:hypothetical protein
VAKTARPRVLRRRLLAAPLLLSLLLAGCGEEAPAQVDFPPLHYEYLSKLRLTVASIDINDAFTPPGAADPQHVEPLAPVAPADALRRMAQDRLVAAGSSGHAVFTIEDASLVIAPGGFAGTMHVRLDITTPDGAKSGFAEARASRTYTTADSSTAGTRAALYELVKLMMSDMNVEFEYQVKRTLKDYLQAGDGTAPPPPPVQQQNLDTGTPPPGTDQPPPLPPAQ